VLERMGMLMKIIGGQFICFCVLLHVLVAGGESLEAPELKVTKNVFFLFNNITYKFFCY